MKAETTIISMAIAAIIGGFILAGARAEEPRRYHYLQIACSEATFTNPIFTNKMEIAWTYLTQDPDCSDLWAGWQNSFRRVADTNVTCYVYRNSIKNILGDLMDTTTPSVISNVVARIEAMPQCKGAITRRPTQALTDWGIEPKPEEGP